MSRQVFNVSYIDVYKITSNVYVLSSKIPISRIVERNNAYKIEIPSAIIDAIRDVLKTDPTGSGLKVEVVINLEKKKWYLRMYPL